uniref:Uncharacterized protein n=1 Tax=Oryza punctata TaxID=4537 RepID=A0A0E0KMX1_ORYPU
MDLERGVIAEALEKAKALKSENGKLKSHNDSLATTKALRGEIEEGKSLAARARDEADSAVVYLTEPTNSAKEVSYVLRLALSDLGTNSNDLPREGSSAVDFKEWSQQASGALTDAAGIYGECCA